LLCLWAQLALGCALPAACGGVVLVEVVVIGFKSSGFTIALPVGNHT
jgi:hypothetical protein